MKKPIIQNYNRDHRLRNTCDGYYPDIPKSPAWVWLLWSTVAAILILASLVFA
jgi:hypothetical protein